MAGKKKKMKGRRKVRREGREEKGKKKSMNVGGGRKVCERKHYVHNDRVRSNLMQSLNS